MPRGKRGSRTAGGGSSGDGADMRAKILRVVEQHQREYGWPPSIREIGEVVGIESTSHIAHHLAMLVKQGLLTHERGISRGRAIARPRGVPILGRIAAGAPLDLFDTGQPDVLDVEVRTAEMQVGPVNPVNPEADVYALQVSGQSMIEDGILDGDYVLVRPDVRVTKGAIVVAVERNANGGHGAATLKRIFIADDYVCLQPANADHTPRYITPADWDRDWMIQGAMVGLYRRCTPRPTGSAGRTIS